MALTAGAGGFAAVWTDNRDGNMALFLGLLDARGQTPIDGAPLHLPRTSRQMLPDVALLPGASAGTFVGGAAWSGQEMNGRVAMLRFFEAAPGALDAGEERAAGAALVANPLHLAPLATASSIQLALTPEAGFVAWVAGADIGGYALRRSPKTGRFESGGQVLFCSGAKPVGGAFELALDPDGHALAAWAEAREAGLVLRVAARDLRSKEPGEPHEFDMARPLGLEVDAAGGFWLLFMRDTDVLLQHLELDGQPSSNQPPTLVTEAAAKSAELTTWGEGLGTAVLVKERPASADDPTPIRLHVFAPGAKRLTPRAGVDVLDADASGVRDAHVAALGTSFLVAWTDSREDSADVFFRLFDLSSPMPVARRWNQDVGASNQVNAAVGSNGRTALVAWIDGRRGGSELYTRAVGLSPEESLALGSEVPASATPPGPQAFPSVTIAASGRALITWKEDLGGVWGLRAMVTESDGTPIGLPFDVDRGHQAMHTFPADSLALPGNAGFLLTWIRADEGASVPMACRFDLDGQPVSEPHALLSRETKDPGNPTLTQADDGRLLVLWDQLGPSVTAGVKKEARLLAGTFVDPSGSPLGKPLAFPPSPEGGDLDPTLAPLLGGGYLLAWTGNDGPSRDVFARTLDERGQPDGPPLALSVRANEQDFPEALRLPDGRILVAWEDDISGIDHGFLRSIELVRGGAGQRAELGPRLLIDGTETVFVEDRHAPLLVPLGKGVLLVWDDVARGHGHDIVGRFFAPE